MHREGKKCLNVICQWKYLHEFLRDFFLTRKGYLHQPPPTAIEAAGLHTSRHTLSIGLEVHHGVLNIHRRFYRRCNTRIRQHVFGSGRWTPPPFGTHQEIKNIPTPKISTVFTKQNTHICLFEYVPLNKPSTPTALLEYSLWDPLSQNTPNFTNQDLHKKLW